jgi:N utilization substance protein B
LQLLFQHDFNAKIARTDVVRFISDRLRDSLNAEFCIELYDGVLANMEEIDRRLGEAAENWRLPRMAAVDRNVLRLGAHELLYVPETPAGVSLNEAIELARRFGSAESPAFVNGVLDRLLKSGVREGVARGQKPVVEQAAASENNDQHAHNEASDNGLSKSESRLTPTSES